MGWNGVNDVTELVFGSQYVVNVEKVAVSLAELANCS